VWFRLVKWMAIVAIGVVFWRSVYFWLGLLGALVLGLLLHLFWRWKTKGWTQPWGGWNDLDTGRKD
jgi:hypothetical protein